MAHRILALTALAAWLAAPAAAQQDFSNVEIKVEPLSPVSTC